MSRKQRKRLTQIGITIILFAFALILSSFSFLNEQVIKIFSYALLFSAYLVVGFSVLKEAFRGIINGQIFDENFLMCIATIGAILIGEYHEAVAVMLFYQIGEWFQSFAVGRARESIAQLMDIRPDEAIVEREGTTVSVDPTEVAINEIILVCPGERLPLDGEILQGTSALDTSALTGESMPRDVCEGDNVLSGCINLTGLLRIRVTKVYNDSTVARILDLVENASDKKAKIESFITRFAHVYTPAVCILALLLFLVPTVMFKGSWNIWGYRALSFLVVSCPCALVISVPLSFFGGIGAASKHGILVKGSNQLEMLSKAGIAVFDKTGTLTKGIFSVARICPHNTTKEELMKTTVTAEVYSSHPVSRCICKAYGDITNLPACEEVQEKPGFGVIASCQNQIIAVGNHRLMEQMGIDFISVEEEGTVIHVAKDGVYQGFILITDEPKEHSAKAIQQLRKEGVQKTIMLTGDKRLSAEKTAAKLDIDEVHYELLPEDKLMHMEKLLQDKKDEKHLIYVGDGINDAPVLMRADVGIAMGGLGSDAAVEAADIVLMDDDPAKLPLALQISKQTLRIVKQNIYFALTVKLLVLLLAALGITGMWLAVFADVGVSFIAIINAMRALYVSKR